MMRVMDPGHEYALDRLDGPGVERLVFVKREGEKYPGNVGSHSGTTLQEVIRALLDRVDYLDEQVPCGENTMIASKLADCLILLEARAARMHGRELSPEDRDRVVSGVGKCRRCGHVGCPGCG